MSRVVEFRGEIPGQAKERRETTHAFPLWLRAGFWACIVIAVAAVIGRVFALLYPPSLRSAAIGCARQSVRVSRHADSGAHSPRLGFCPSYAILRIP
jgi:anti-sigma-K factor RskA